MAKATITYTDEEDGTIHLSAEFDPPLSEDTESPAQYAAVKAIQAAQRSAVSEGAWEDDDE